MAFEFHRTYRSLKRYRQVIGVLVKYGFGEILDRMNIASYLHIGRRKLFARHQELASLSYAERIRLALEELGPTFVKMGQVLSTRPFLVPLELVEELSKLQDEVAPFPFAEVEQIIEAELTESIDELFSQFSPEPIAAASLSQVHKAVTISGDTVAVKVQRPNTRETMAQDIVILRDFARLLDRYVTEVKQFDIVGMVEELWKTTRQEIDFEFEARNLEVFSINFENDNRIFLPKIYWELTTPRVLTLEFIDGIKINDIERLKEAGIDPKVIVHVGGEIVAKQVFEDGFFHADPHPGNLFALKGNIIAPVDFGMMGRLSNTAMELVSDLMVAATANDSRRLVRVMQNHELIEDDINFAALEADLSGFLHRYHKIPLAKLNMRSMISDAFTIFTTYRIKFPTELMMLGKALVTFEEVGRLLYPEYDFVSALMPHVKKLATRKLSLSSIGSDIAGTLVDFRELVVNFPFELRRITRKLRKGELSISFVHKRLEPLILELEKASNRLAFALIIAAIIIGSSLILSRPFGLSVYGVPVLGFIGFITAGLLGIWLVIAILRSGKL